MRNFTFSDGKSNQDPDQDPHWFGSLDSDPDPHRNQCVICGSAPLCLSYLSVGVVPVASELADDLSELVGRGLEGLHDALVFHLG